MIMTVIGLSLMAALVLVAVTAVNGDSHLTARDLQQKQAYEAAKAGIDDYAYHLHANNSYWTTCTEVDDATRSTRRTAIHRSNRPRTGPGQAPAPNTRSNCCPRPPAHTASATPRTPDRKHAPVAGPAEGHLPHPLHRLRRANRTARSSPPSSRPASSTTSTSPSARPRTRVTYGDRIADRGGAKRSAARRSTTGRYDAEIANKSMVLQRDLLRHRRLHQRPDAHQRRLRDLRHPHPRARSAADPVEVSGAARRLVLDQGHSPLRVELHRLQTTTSKGPLQPTRRSLTPPPTNSELQRDRRRTVQVQRPGPHLPQRRIDDGDDLPPANSCGSPSEVSVQRPDPRQRSRLRRKRHLLQRLHAL